MTDEGIIDNQTHYEKDANGDIVHSPDVVDTGEIQYARNNTGFSGRLSDRPLVSSGPVALTVGTDTSTIQEALNQIPLILRHSFYIDIPDGTYAEDLLVPPMIIADTAGEADQGAGGDEGASQIPWIQGNVSTPTNVQVNSITLTGTQGAIAPIIEGLNVTGDTPYDDEITGVNIFGCQNVSFRHISFAGSTATRGFLPYSSTVTLRAIDFGSGDLDYGVETKHNANVNMDDYGGQTTGSVNNYVIWNNDGSVVTFYNVAATGGTGFINNNEGHAFDADWKEQAPVAGLRATGSGSDQSISSGVETTVAYDTTSGDGFSLANTYDLSDNRVTAPEYGRYYTKAKVQWLGPSGTTDLELSVKRDDNGSISRIAETEISGTATNPTQEVEAIVPLNAGTDIFWTVEHNEGTSLNINVDDSVRSDAFVYRLK